jgi:hypothetical protein
MEHFVMPADKVKLVDWLLQTAATNNWVVVFEYAADKTYRFLTKRAVEVALPVKAKHQHHSAYRLTALVNLFSSEKLVQKLMSQCTVLSIHNSYQMLFLITDDFHEECFSCRASFYTRYSKILDEQDLIYAY